jgi:hypothetical protein
MSTYTGYFVVINNTGATITNVAVTHYTTDFGANTFHTSSLPDATTSPPTPLKTSTSNKDRWSVAFIGAGGQLFTGQENCGFESEDNGGTVRVILNPEDWDIYMPVSSPCLDNDYDQT